MRSIGTNPPSRRFLRLRSGLTTALLVSLGAAPASVAAQTTHRLPLTPQNIHWGYYDASIEPVLTIRSGDRVAFENLLARGLGRLSLAGFDESRFSPSMVAVESAARVRVIRSDCTSDTRRSSLRRPTML